MNPDYAIPEDLQLHPDHSPIQDPVEAPSELTTSRSFRAWFQASKVSTDSGKPLMVFHGTARENRAFKSSRHQDLEGAYFTSSFKEAKAHAYMDSEIDCEQPYVIAAFIRLNNPFVMCGFESQVISTEKAQALMAEGFDGVIGVYEENDLIGEYVVFDPNQIAQFHEGKIEIPVMPAPSRKRAVEWEDSSPAP